MQGWDAALPLELLGGGSPDVAYLAAADAELAAVMAAPQLVPHPAGYATPAAGAAADADLAPEFWIPLF